jgi:hypothetical protein
MKFKEYIEEEYLTRISIKGNNPKTTEVFRNPSAKDLQSIPGGTVRFCIDWKTEKLYVWNVDFLHKFAVDLLDNYLPGNNYPEDDENYYYGRATVYQGKLLFHPMKDTEEIFKNVPWLKKYFHKKMFEEYAFTGRSYSGKTTYEIFVNPSTKELGTAKNDEGKVRFCIDLDKKKLYVWSVNFDHALCADFAEKEGYWEKSSYDKKYYWKNPYVFAVGKIEGTKIQIINQEYWEGSNIDWDTYEKKLRNYGTDVSWLKHWFTKISYSDLSEYDIKGESEG